MADPTSADWTNLNDAYGSARELPSLVETWSKSPSDKLLSELWGWLCHQGTVYPASFAAIPLLLDASRNAEVKMKREALVLIAGILASNDRYGNAAPSEAVAGLVPEVAEELQASMLDSSIDRLEFPYLLQAAAALRGESFWGRHLGSLSVGEFSGKCLACNAELYIAIGQYGYFISADDWVRSDTLRTPIQPITENEIPSESKWMIELATRHSQETTKRDILYIFGKANCPKCGRTILVADTIINAVS